MLVELFYNTQLLTEEKEQTFRVLNEHTNKKVIENEGKLDYTLSTDMGVNFNFIVISNMLAFEMRNVLKIL